MKYFFYFILYMFNIYCNICNTPLKPFTIADFSVTVNEC